MMDISVAIASLVQLASTSLLLSQIATGHITLLNRYVQYCHRYYHYPYIYPPQQLNNGILRLAVYLMIMTPKR